MTLPDFQWSYPSLERLKLSWDPSIVKISSYHFIVTNLWISTGFADTAAYITIKTNTTPTSTTKYIILEAKDDEPIYHHVSLSLRSNTH